jgi:hypothetical protein
MIIKRLIRLLLFIFILPWLIFVLATFNVLDWIFDNDPTNIREIVAELFWKAWSVK